LKIVPAYLELCFDLLYTLTPKLREPAVSSSRQ